MPKAQPKKSSKKRTGGSRQKTESNKTTGEKFEVYGHEALKKIKELVKEGNIRRIIIRNEKDKVLMEIPVTFAVVGTVFAPVLAAIGALAAVLNKCTIEVERKK
jgi:hypothetical protein